MMRHYGSQWLLGCAIMLCSITAFALSSPPVTEPPIFTVGPFQFYGSVSLGNVLIGTFLGWAANWVRHEILKLGVLIENAESLAKIPGRLAEIERKQDELREMCPLSKPTRRTGADCDP